MVLEFFYKDKVYSPGRNIGDYTVIKIMGEGRFGICYLVRDGQTQYIIKQLKRGMLRRNKAKAGYEAEILMSVQHERIPKFIKELEFKNFYGYVLEFKAGRTLEEVIYDEEYIFPPLEIYQIGLQVIDLLKYLHGRNIVHRDIRVPNILYDGGQLYLLDFGLARWIDNKKYTVDIDFSYLGDFLLHLYYTSFEFRGNKKKVWYEELDLSPQQSMFLKRLLGLEQRYKSIAEVERDFILSHSPQNYNNLPQPQ
ncbi:MAG: protein kinase family protein [Desulfotomaculaceae bacterium]|nr:protein kinase family protein [Desulfotomaculaceae bacterium]